MVLCVHDMDHMSNPMRQKILPILLIFLSASVFAQNPPNPGNFWQGRVDVSGLDLFDGSGGASRQPGTQFQFLKESLSGTSPKFEVEDENGVKWKVKLGEEVKAETAATRLVWAAGYYVDEDYYRPEIRVEGMKKLSRGQQYVHNGTVVNVRLERHRSGPDPMTWNWYEDSYSNTREFNGLRVVMALINNWDLKEVNNAVYERSDGKNFAVADLGATFGRTGNYFRRSKGRPQDYANAPFIQKVRGNEVDFVMHSRPFILTIVKFRNYRMRTKMETVAKHIPIEDARWIGEVLGRLSASQIHDCFRAGGFSPDDEDVYTRAVMQRIAMLKAL